jgi:hypothetical protein
MLAKVLLLSFLFFCACFLLLPVGIQGQQTDTNEPSTTNNRNKSPDAEPVVELMRAKGQLSQCILFFLNQIPIVYQEQRMPRILCETLEQCPYGMRCKGGLCK